MDEEEQVQTVPNQFALKSVSNQKYLSFVRKEKEAFGYLQFSGEKVMSPHTKFELETSTLGKGFFHIRCCSNNRYWVLHSESSHYVVAGATKPDEDKSKHTCTLFKPVYDGSRGGFLFRNAHLNLNLHLHGAASSGAPKDCLFAKSSNPEADRSDLVTAVDWESLCFLPRYVAFKGHNGRYLRPIHYLRQNIFIQSCSSDISDPAVKHEIVTLPDGHVRIKNVAYNKYWVYDTNWIIVAGDENSANNRRTWFLPIKVDNNVVAFRSMGNNNICESLSVDGKENCLNANTSSITSRAKIEVNELVLSREIYDINFQLSSTKIYNEKPILLATGTVENLKDTVDKLSVKLSYEDTVIKTWNSKMSMTYGVKMSVELSASPRISGKEVEMSFESSEEYEWGKTERTKTIVEVTHEVAVPAWRKVKGSIIATQATYDVPFSYSQRDKLMNGKTVISRLEDGVFTGFNYYNYKFLAEEV